MNGESNWYTIGTYFVCSVRKHDHRMDLVVEFRKKVVERISGNEKKSIRNPCIIKIYPHKSWQIHRHIYIHWERYTSMLKTLYACCHFSFLKWRNKRIFFSSFLNEKEIQRTATTTTSKHKHIWKIQRKIDSSY